MYIEQITTDNMLAVLMYLFENHMDSDCKLDCSPRRLTTKLNKIGFKKNAINKALNWLAELTVLQYNIKYSPPHEDTIRIYSQDERIKISKEGRSFIMSLEQMDILNSGTRELVISQIMQLDQSKISINQIKWVALMVLFNQPDHRDALLCMEHLVLSDETETIH